MNVSPMKPHLSLLFGFACLSLGSLAGAATREEYRAASIGGLRELISFGRAQGMVKQVLAGTPGGKITIVGRGEIMLISQLLLAGREASGPATARPGARPGSRLQ